MDQLNWPELRVFSMTNLYILIEYKKTASLFIFSVPTYRVYLMLGKILFIGQPEYFRAVYYDAIAYLNHAEFYINSGNFSPFKKISAVVKEKKIDTIIMFRPEWLSQDKDVFFQLKKMNVRMIGYSTEPIPLRNSVFNHKDLKNRFENLKAVRELPWDLIVHYDLVSEKFLRDNGFDKLIFHPLTASKCFFYPENCVKDFDFCFLGRSTPHREAFLAPLKTLFNVIHIAHGVVDGEARDIINRSKVVLNIHNEMYNNFENRVPQALLCHKLLLSEPLTGNILKPNKNYLVFHSPEELIGLAVKCLNGEITFCKADDEQLEHFDVRHLLRRIAEYFEQYEHK